MVAAKLHALSMPTGMQLLLAGLGRKVVFLAEMLQKQDR